MFLAMAVPILIFQLKKQAFHSPSLRTALGAA
jgi:hypothetical protein